MATTGQTRYDKYLTNLALSYPVGNLVGTLVAPIKQVDNYSDKVFVDGDDAIMQMNDEAEAVTASSVDFTIGSAYSYRTKRRALSTVILDKEAKNAETIVKLEQRETYKLTHRLRLKHEKRIADILKSTSKVTNYIDLSDTAYYQWDDTDTSDVVSLQILSNINTAINSIYDNTGATANTIVIPFAAALQLANKNFIKDTLKYQYGMEVVTAEFQRQVMQLVGLPPAVKGLRVVVSNGRLGDYNKGETASVTAMWGKDVLIGYVPQNNVVEDMFGIMTMEYGGFGISKERINDPRGTKILAEWDYDILEANLACWYLMQNVIS